MVRHLYAPLFVQLAGTASPAPNLPFRVYTDLIAGSDVTSQLVTPVDQTAYTAITDSQGNIAPFRGPDGYMGSLFADTGAAYRFEFNISPTLLDYLVTNAANGGSGGSAVTSVSGRTGDVTVTKLDVGLGNVANIAPADMPVSTATQSALAGKPDDSAIVHKAGSENITGVKTYTASPVVPTPVNPTDAANKAYVDANAGTGGGTGGAVSSVAGRTGAVTLTKSDVGLANVDNTADANKPLSTAAQNALALKAPLASPTFTGTVTVPTPVNATDAATRAFVLANAGSGGGGGASSVQRYEIPAANLTAWPSAGTEAQKLAAINANTTLVRNALINNPGKNVVLDPQQPWPLAIDINEFNDTTFPAGQDYTLSGPAMLCRGTKTSSTDTSTSRIQPKPVLSIVRKAGSNVVVPTNLRNSVQVGPNNPNSGSVFTGICSGFDITSGAAQFKGGQIWHLASQDGYAWSARAGYANVWQAAMFPVAGLMIVVSGETYTALAAAAPQNPSISSLERRTIVGASSGATALVQGDISGTNQIVVNSVSKDFTSGETLKDQATNATVGTFGGCTVLMSGTLNTTYTTTPQLRLVTRSVVDLSGLRVYVDSDPDDFVPGYNRTDALGLTGCTDVNLDGLKIGGGYLAGIALRSCWNVRGEVDIRGLANHALEEADSTLHLSPSGMPTEGAYGYCVRLLGATQNFGIGINAEYARHAETTNGIGGSWNLDARTGSTSGSVNNCTNFWNHGPGARKGYFYGKAAHMYGTAWDTHEGAEDIVWLNPIAVDPMSGARSTTSADGCTFRGFNLTLINPYFTGVRIGVNEQGIALGAGGLVWTNRILGGYIQAQFYPYAQTEDADFDAESRFVLDGVTLRGDPNVPIGTMAQAGMMIRRGNTRTKNIRIEAINDRMVRHTSFVGSGSTGVGRVIHEDITFDWTDSTASRAFSFEATYGGIEINGAHAYVNPVAGTQKPFFWFVNQAGDTKVRYKGLMATSLSSTTATPTTSPQITAGTPTFTNVDPTGSGSGSGGTQITVDGASVAALEISSTPVVQLLSIGADIAGPAASTTVSDLSQFQTPLTAGTYIVHAVLLYTSSVAGAGALRFGLGGAGSANAFITNVMVDQNTSVTAKSLGVLSGLATSGTTAVTTAGSANVVGLSAGVAATTLPVLIDGKLSVTSGGTLGLVWQLSNGATTTVGLKAGSYITFTKVS